MLYAYSVQGSGSISILNWPEGGRGSSWPEGKRGGMRRSSQCLFLKPDTAIEKTKKKKIKHPPLPTAQQKNTTRKALWNTCAGLQCTMLQCVNITLAGIRSLKIGDKALKQEILVSSNSFLVSFRESQKKHTLLYSFTAWTLGSFYDS